MNYSPKDLVTEIYDVITDRCDQGDIISRGWVCTAVLAKHKITRLDDFSLCCRQMAVSAAVDAALARMKRRDEGDDDPDVEGFEAPRLPGFKHLRRVYPIRRDGVVMLVPIDLMTVQERNAKADTYERASIGFAEHAEEIRRYGSAVRAA
jgi:hypothetical protein